MPDPDISVRVGLDHDPDDPALTYTDITDRVLYGAGGQAVTVQIGRQDETGEIRPTEMGWAVRNADNAMTPRNPASPYYGKWETGRRVQIAETVGGVEHLLGTGYLEIPEMAIVDPRSSQPVTVTAVDRLGRAEAAPNFQGTLAEHIRANDDGMVEWWPLDDQGATTEWLSAAGTPLRRYASGWSTAAITADPDQLIQPTGIAGPSGDDQSYALWAPVGDAGGIGEFAQADLRATVDLTVGLTEMIAISAWVYLGEYDMAPTSEEPQGWTVNLTSSTHGIALLKDYQPIPIDELWSGSRVYVPASASYVYANAGRPYERGNWRLVTVRYTMSTGLLEYWSGADYAGSTTTTVPSVPMALNDLRVGNGWSGGIAHVQIRIGASVLSHAEHLAQYQHGMSGLDRQTVAERIVTVAGYAGIPATELDVPDTASTPLLPARLAGANPATELRSTAASGQDTLICAPDGRITVVPRAQRYNQAVTMEIPWGWIGWRGVRYRPDRPVTDVTVSRGSGGTVRRQDRTLAARYGVTSLSYSLDSAIDADAGNLASWTLAAYAEMRTRSPGIRINMLDRTVSERQQLLSLRVGDRIELTGLPAGSPEDVPHLIVQGIRHTIGPGRRRFIEFNTSPLLGPAVGEPPACPMVGDLVSDSAIVAY